jgi:hypothetical protein
VKPDAQRRDDFRRAVCTKLDTPASKRAIERKLLS